MTESRAQNHDPGVSTSARTTLLLLLLPALFVGLAMWARWAAGPLWWGANLDPEYQYLFFGLELADFHIPSNFEHPGTTSVFINAIVVTLVWLVLGIRDGWGSKAESVLVHHETYTYAMAVAGALLIGLMLFLLGRRIHRLTGSWWAVLAVQLGPLLSFLVIRQSCRVSPEPFEILSALLLVYVLVPAAIGSDPVRAARDPKVAIGAGVAVALAIASKFICFTLAPMLLLLSGSKQKARAAAACGGALLLLLIPVFNNLAGLQSFFDRKSAEVGVKSAGSGLWETVTAFWASCQRVLDAERLLPWSLVICLVILAVSFFSKPAAEDLGRRRRLRLASLLTALTLAAHVVFLAVRFRSHYLLPVVVLCCFVLVLAVEVARDARFGRLARAVTVLAILTTVGLSAMETRRDIRRFSAGVDGLRRQLAKIEVRRGELADCVTYGYFRSSAPAFALTFGNDFTSGRYAETLEALYPGYVKYHVFRGQFRSWSGQNRRTEVERMIRAGRCVLVQGDPTNSNEILGFQLRPVLPPEPRKRTTEGLFRLSIDTANPSLIAMPRPPRSATVIEAERFEQGNLVQTTAGKTTTVTSDALPAWAEYTFRSEKKQSCAIRIRYASGEERPVKLRLNGEIVFDSACPIPTGGFAPENQQWHDLGLYEFVQGDNIVRLESDAAFPNIDQIAIRRVLD